MAFSSILPTLAIVLIAGCFAEKDVEHLHRFDMHCIDHRLVVSYEDILSLPKEPHVLLIDVRRPEDLKVTGSIPHSINMPFEVVKQDLQLKPELFESKYGRKKPSMDTLIIFTSRTGQRADEASHMAYRMGFRNVKTYVGSWNEYARIKGLRQE